MNRKRVYLACPGINTKAEDPQNWCPVFSTQVNIETDAKGDEYRYFSDPVFRRLRQQKHAEDLASLCILYIKAGYEVVGVAHSNGCDLWLRVVAILAQRSKEDGVFYSLLALHLIAGACEHDFQKNGLNLALTVGTVGTVYCYCSPVDKAVGFWAKASQSLSFLGLGYGLLAVKGPTRVQAGFLNTKVIQITKNFGHSDWFSKENWESTFQAITVHERLHSI